MAIFASLIKYLYKGKVMFLKKIKIIFVPIVIIFFMFGSIRIACGIPCPIDSTNIVLVTLDTLRADHLGCYGYNAIKTPNIDRLAQDGILFTNVYSPVPLTLPSHVSIMTSQYPTKHGIQNNGTFVLPDSAKTLAEILKDSGYKTGAVIASYVLASNFGMNQGFDDYDEDVYQNMDKMQINIPNYRTGKVVTDSAKGWLSQNHKKPFFLWVHYFDPHTPYDPPPPFDQSYKGSPYDGEIAYTDQCLGQLFKEMKKLSLLENTCIIVVGDHGEGLWEHNEKEHGVFIYDTTLRVPLIMCYPKLFKKGNKITSLVRTIDIMPTILELLDIRVKGDDLQGMSLVSLLTGKEKQTNLNLYCESRYSKLSFNWAPLEGIVTFDGWKYINAPKPELYHLEKDPHEKENLLLKDPGKAKLIKERFQKLKKDLSIKSLEQEGARTIVVSPEMRERLSSLGYISYSGSNNEADSLLPDPKDKTSLLAQIEAAQDLEAKGEIGQAIHNYEEALREDPKNKVVLYCLGLAYKNSAEPKNALSNLKKLEELDPQNFDCQNALGLVYDMLGEPEKAINAYKEALRLNPKIAYIHDNLGNVYLKINALDLAAHEFQQVSSLSQNPIITSMAIGNLGGIYLRQGELENAAKKFKKSIRLNSLNRDARISLADTYYHLGDIDQSINEWKNILDIWPDDYILNFRLAQLFLEADKSDQAILYLKKCIRIRPDYIEAKRLLNQIYQNVTLISP